MRTSCFYSLLLLPFLFSTALHSDDKLKPSAVDKQVSIIISTMIDGDDGQHLLRRPLDDEISRRAMKQFFKSLDPWKLYFYQSDFDEFTREEANLDEKLQSGKLDFAFTVYNRFLQRIDERVKMANEWIDAKLDFTRDETLNTDQDSISYPKNAAEARERWRKRIKYSFLVLKATKVEGNEARDKLRRRYRAFQKRMSQFKSDRVLEMFANAITTSYDPHTSYFSKTTYENFQISMSLKLEGIGASLQSEDGITVIKRIVPGGAADKEGSLKVEDRIVSVGQGKDEGELVDVIDMNLDDVVKLIRGKAGTVVRLGVMPQGNNEVKVYRITREKIELKDSEAHGAVFEQGTKPDGKPFQVGVIDLPSFYLDLEAAQRGDLNYKSATKDLRRLIGDFREKGVDAIVLDLRRNGGGSLSEAIGCTGLFIDRGPVVQIKGPFGNVNQYNDRRPGMAWDGPLVVVTSQFSASASEILAGAVQDYKRGLVVGDRATHGKGTVQSLINLWQHLNPSVKDPSTEWGALKITQSQFYRPGGASTQKKGVEADIVLPSFSDHMDVGEGDLDYAVEFDKVKAAKFSGNAMVNPEIVKELTDRSKTRIAKSEDFKDLESRISEYIKEKTKNTVTLNEKKFFERELDAEKEDEKTLEKQVNGDTKINRDFYLDEVMAITTDYVTRLKKSDSVN
ncbi:MAG: carboxy terminal-processing peptidase [Planctomycetota bacterium]|nr:carboxy terminal-processing peptidase [Planctomycetota bacterium]